MRIGVNIPDDLYQRMKPLKLTENISQICREAIEVRVEAYEQAYAWVETDGVDEVIDRLTREVDWTELGRSDAKTWVAGAKLEDFDYLFHRLGVLKRQGRPPWLVPPPHIEGAATFQQRAWELDDWFVRLNERHFELNQAVDTRADAEQKYMRAWVAYVTVVWNKIRQRRERRAKELLKARRLSEVPEESSLDQAWPVHPTAAWPEDLSLRREDMYGDRV